MAKAELKFNIGADGTQAKQEIKEVKKQGLDVVGELQNKNREALKNVIGRFSIMAVLVTAAMKLIAKVMEQVNNHIEKGAKVFETFAEKAKISTHSVAYLKAMADSAGVSTKEFERALEDLANGGTSIDLLRKKWGALGDSINTAKNAQENFSKLAQKRGFELFNDTTEKFFGKGAFNFLEMVGLGAHEITAIENAAYEGKSYREAYIEGAKAKPRWAMGIADWRKERAYFNAVAKKQQDEVETRERLIDNTAKKLAEADISADDRERIFKEQTGISLSNDAILSRALSLKTSQDNLTDAIKKATEEEKKRVEEEKKKAEEQKKFNEDYLKIQGAIKDTFTTGGGLIGGVDYSMRRNDPAVEMNRMLREQLEDSKKQTKTLKSIETVLKED